MQLDSSISNSSESERMSIEIIEKEKLEKELPGPYLSFGKPEFSLDEEPMIQSKEYITQEFAHHP